MKSGDKIRLRDHYGDCEDFVVEEFRYCLGIFKSDMDRKAGAFTPLCNLYEPGAESEKKYLSNWGEYTTNKVQAWMDIL